MLKTEVGDKRTAVVNDLANKVVSSLMGSIETTKVRYNRSEPVIVSVNNDDQWWAADVCTKVAAIMSESGWSVFCGRDKDGQRYWVVQ